MGVLRGLEKFWLGVHEVVEFMYLHFVLLF
jgi:hypothetical protein